MQNFITIPETKLDDGTIVPAFQVGQHLCSRGDDGKAVVVAGRAPWIVKTAEEARQACEDAGLKLLTALQFNAICAHIGSHKMNWVTKAGKTRLAFDRGWMVVTPGKRIFRFGGKIRAWIDKNATIPGPDNNKGDGGFFATMDLP